MARMEPGELGRERTDRKSRGTTIIVTPAFAQSYCQSHHEGIEALRLSSFLLKDESRVSVMSVVGALQCYLCIAIA